MWNPSVVYTRIKLCWFEYLEAAYEASFLGADALGFHLIRSNTPDWPKKAERFRSFFDVLPKHIDKTLLIDFDEDVVIEALRRVPFDAVQLYPDWDRDTVARIRDACPRPIKILKLMSARPEENAARSDEEFLERYADVVDAFLLDSHRAGGTGRTADLEHCAAIVRQSPRPVFLAGGLNADNVAAVIDRVRPFGVDVETGVSDVISDGVMLKNMRKCRDFIEAVAHADREALKRAAR